MPGRIRIGRNDLCPCGTGKKYKRCCEGKVDWSQAIKDRTQFRENLSIRGRNLFFVSLISEALQLDRLGPISDLKQYKAAFTANAVRRIHEAVMEVWPPDLDIEAVLQDAASEVSGLYVGDYGPEYIYRGIVRHSIYANKILVVDPFIYPRSVRDQYNPILEPEQYRAQTLSSVNFWFALLPWIKAGIVEIIRTPADFDQRLNWESMKRQRKKFDENEELKKAAEVSAEEAKSRHFKKFGFQSLLQIAPDSYIRRTFEELQLGKEGYTADDFLKYIQEQREQDPNFLAAFGQGLESGQLQFWTTGCSYDIAKLTAGLTRSYLVTDLHVRWREIELDRESHSVENKVWAPFAKAVQNTTLKYLNELRLEHALTLREEGRLESLRGFLRRVWKDACSGEPFDEANAQLLAEELQEKVLEAEEEWNQIDKGLLKMIAAEFIPGLLAAGPLIASGYANWVAAAAVAAGTYDLAWSKTRRRGFPDRFPAAFFMNLGKNA